MHVVHVHRSMPPSQDGSSQQLDTQVTIHPAELQEGPALLGTAPSPVKAYSTRSWKTDRMRVPSPIHQATTLLLPPTSPPFPIRPPTR